jgi:aryl-alcohol dehydrogenase-like predicted oxidoreductase
MTVGSKWGYRYTGDWRLDAPRQEVKDHSLAAFESQLAQTRAILGSSLALYQVHSLTEDSDVLGDTALLAAMARLRSDGVMIGLTTSGPLQATTLRRALDTTVDGEPLFSAAEVTWNLLEPSVEPAAGWAVLIKEAVANGRLAPGGDMAGPSSPLGRLAAAHGLTPDSIALAAALAKPWATVLLSGAVTRAELTANLAALTITDLPAPDLGIAEPAGAYWSARSHRPWT